MWKVRFSGRSVTKSFIYFELEITFFFSKGELSQLFYSKWSQLLEHYLSWCYPVTISSCPGTGRRRRQRLQPFSTHSLWDGFVLPGFGGCQQCRTLDHPVLGELEASLLLPDRHNALHAGSLWRVLIPLSHCLCTCQVAFASGPNAQATVLSENPLCLTLESIYTLFGITNSRSWDPARVASSSPPRPS